MIASFPLSYNSYSCQQEVSPSSIVSMYQFGYKACYHTLDSSYRYMFQKHALLLNARF